MSFFECCQLQTFCETLVQHFKKWKNTPLTKHDGLSQQKKSDEEVPDLESQKTPSSSPNALSDFVIIDKPGEKK
jgi:hypothetical protein